MGSNLTLVTLIYYLLTTSLFACLTASFKSMCTQIPGLIWLHYDGRVVSDLSNCQCLSKRRYECENCPLVAILLGFT